jgi:hypothetical protein
VHVRPYALVARPRESEALRSLADAPAELGDRERAVVQARQLGQETVIDPRRRGHRSSVAGEVSQVCANFVPKL